MQYQAARRLGGPELLSAEQRSALDTAFQIGFYEAVLRSEPEHLEALHALGHLYTAVGRHEDGLRIDEQLVRLTPQEPVVHYNLACSLALLGRTEQALQALARAIALGYRDADHMIADPDLASLRELDGFWTLYASIAEGDPAPEGERGRGAQGGALG
ncbi:MAG: hypothetical protein KatS3mg102_2578 [Planctomycetota bacterium]|nr:MAG: hypothetical protein KatS3mg102_2578 [Planctomycetota bacterium]